MFGFIRYSVEKKIAGGGGGGGVFYVWTKLNCKQLLGQSLKVINKSHIQQCQNSSKKNDINQFSKLNLTVCKKLRN